MTGPDPDDNQVDFFISYTGSDEAWATWVAHQLETAGYRVLIQAWDFGTGIFIEHMEKAVCQSDRLLPILSNAYLTSRYCRLEWAAFMKESPERIIPIQVEEIRRRSLLMPQVRINLVGLAEQKAKDKLLGRMKKYATPGYGPPDRREGGEIDFPVTADGEPADTKSTGTSPETSAPTLAIDRDRIQLILLGDGQAAGEAAASLASRLDGTRQCNLFGSGLPADEQLRQVAELVENLDPDDVSDVLVIFAGQGSDSSNAGIHLHVRATDPSQPASTAISLAKLLERLQYGAPPRLRSYIILDAVDAAGQAVGPSAPAAVPVLKNGRDHPGRRGLAAISEALARPAEELTGELSHLGPLCLADLRALAGGELVALEGSPAYLIGLMPNPLAWPRERTVNDHLTSWCAVISESDGGRRPEVSVRHTVGRLADYSLNALKSAYGRFRPAIQLESRPGELLAGNVLSSPGAFARAVEQVCRADLAIFDLTNFEPAVMVLLGIRAVIRRGLTVCVAGEHDPPWRGAEPPFHLREVSLITPPDRDALLARMQEGIRQLALSGTDYRDLPCFDLIRAVPPDPEQRRTRAFDAKNNPSILALVPFDADYVGRNWRQIKQDLPEVARDMTSGPRPQAEGVQQAKQPPRPVLQRTLDLDSPRVVSAQLFEAIRLTDFCLVDLTGARPNVLFELGVRLAANRLHPVVIVDPRYHEAGDGGEAGRADAEWLGKVGRQFGMLRQLLRPVEYMPTTQGVFTQMVERHLEFRRLLQDPSEDPWAESLLGSLPPTGVYDLVWRHAVAGDEVVTTPVAERLAAGGEELLVSQTLGRRHLIYPTAHPLTEAAERTGLEYLIAAWLYLHFRKQAGGGADAALAKSYDALTDKLVVQLDDTREPSDASFRAQLERWHAEADGGQQADEADD